MLGHVAKLRHIQTRHYACVLFSEQEL